MAVRTTETEVRKIIDLDASMTDLMPFITAANELVTELCVPAGYTAGRLKVIETWLAAHFAAIRDPRISSESLGASVTYQGNVGQNLSLTHWGQQAMLFDTAGTLASLNKGVETGISKAKIGVTWLGKKHRHHHHGEEVCQ
jgi:hypothetical protein